MNFKDIREALKQRLEAGSFEVRLDQVLSPQTTVSLFASKSAVELGRIMVHVSLEHIEDPLEDDFRRLFEASVAYSMNHYAAGSKKLFTSYAVAVCIASERPSEEVITFCQSRQHNRIKGKGFLLAQVVGHDIFPVVIDLQKESILFWQGTSHEDGEMLYGASRRAIEEMLVPSFET